MTRNTKHTRLLISLISNIKEDEIEQSKAKVEKLSALVQKHPHDKLYELRYQIAYRRFEHLLKTSNELKHLQSELF
uniref:hypothetical protein n=1 Tax=Gelidibacter sp. TaxID=2018083 RepID=UPI00404A5A78